MSLRKIAVAALACFATTNCRTEGSGINIPTCTEPELVSCEGLQLVQIGTDNFFQRARAVLENGEVLDPEKIGGNLLGENGAAKFSPVVIGEDIAYQCATIIKPDFLVDKCVEVGIVRLPSGMVRFDGDVREKVEILDTSSLNGKVDFQRKDLIAGEEAREVFLDEKGCSLTTFKDGRILSAQDLRRDCWRKCEKVFQEALNGATDFIADADAKLEDLKNPLKDVNSKPAKEEK